MSTPNACVGKDRVSDLCSVLCASVFFFGATESQVREVVCVKLLGMKRIKKGYGTHSFNLNLHTAQYKVSFTLNM